MQSLAGSLYFTYVTVQGQDLPDHVYAKCLNMAKVVSIEI